MMTTLAIIFAMVVCYISLIVIVYTKYSAVKRISAETKRLEAMKWDDDTESLANKR